MRTICQTAAKHWRGPVGAAGFKEKGGDVVVPAFIMSASSCLRSLPRQQTLLHQIQEDHQRSRDHQTVGYDP